MRFILRLTIWLRRLVLLVVLIALGLVSPVAYTEISCRGSSGGPAVASILPAENRRDESRTYTTYPEWHIVHAYDDYAKVIATGEPHNFGYISAIKGFWSALCPLARKAGEHGGFSGESKQTIYTIGVSFTVEMALKAMYEESVGRVFTLLRGPTRAPLDELSASQAADYALFLQQVPWYRWDFRADAAALSSASSGSLRDRERALALGLEYRVKAAYAEVIAKAVENIGHDALTIRTIVTGLTPDALTAIEGVTVIATRPEGVEIETPRYRAYTAILLEIARRNGKLVEIAGNDDILLTVISEREVNLNALHRFPRQGYGDYRHLIQLKVWGLADRLREFDRSGVSVEHIHDY